MQHGSVPLAFLGVVVFILVVAAGIVYFSQKPQLQNQQPSSTPTLTSSESTKINDQEKARIDLWIEESSLNQYGDPKDTAYTGGTPLFNEVTGESIDRYEYILKSNPDRPWNN